MGNFLDKNITTLNCEQCAKQNIVPIYFVKKPNSTLIAEINNEIYYDKCGNVINNLQQNKNVNEYIYVCSNGHTIS